MAVAVSVDVGVDEGVDVGVGVGPMKSKISEQFSNSLLPSERVILNVAGREFFGIQEML